MVGDADAKEESSDRYARWQLIYVDGRDGRPVAIVEDSLLSSKALAAKQPNPDLVSGKWSLVSGRKVQVKRIKSLPEGDAVDGRIVMRNGSHLIAAEYMKSGRLCFGTSFWEPTANFATDLRVWSKGSRVVFGD